MNELLKAKLNQLPISPGVYLHKDRLGEVIYIGKAAVLRNRVRQYFQTSRSFDNKTLALVNEITDIEWIETDSEVDALFLESEMVKRYLPRYNVLLRDDKSQSFVRIDMNQDWPVVTITRNPVDDGAEYYGPFYNGFALKKALRYLRKVFPHLTEKPRPGQSKLNEDIGLSPNLTGESSSYKADLRQLIGYIKGHRKKIIKDLERQMKVSASEKDFEQAIKIRNKLAALKELQRRVTFGDKEHLDISKDQALADLVEILGLSRIPARIECFDISHNSGTGAVASMVVFSNGVSNRAEYRKLKVSERNDDTANMHEALSRRLADRNLKSWGIPDLIVVDGGKGQLMAALRARDSYGLNIPIVSVAKQREEILVHADSRVSVDAGLLKPENKASSTDDGEFIVINLQLGRGKTSSHSRNFHYSDAVYRFSDITKLIQRIRDESHRFAISYHTAISRGRQKRSLLDDIVGIGPVTKRRLIKEFGSLGSIKLTSEESMARVIGPAKAKIVASALKEKAER